MKRILFCLVLLFCFMINPAFPDVSKTLEEAETLFLEKKYSKAAEKAEKILKEQPDNIRAGLVLAESLNERRRYLKAISLYKGMIEKSPDATELVFNLGVVYNNAGYHANAVTAFEQIIAVEPENIAARYRLGVSYALCMDLSKAYDVYRFLKKHDEKLAGDLLEYIQSNR